MAVKQVKSMVQFTRGSSLVWSTLITPIPDGVVTFSTDDGVFKIGDGVTLYSALPTLFTFNDLVSAQGGVSQLFVEPTIAQNGKIVVVSANLGDNTIKYAPSETSLFDLLAMITQLESENTSQDAAIAELLAYALSIDSSINTGADDSVVISTSRRYSDSGNTIASIRSQVQNLATYEPGSHLGEPIFYSDATKAKVIDKTKLFDNHSYYVEVIGFNNVANSVVYNVIAANSSVVITQISGPLFKITLNNATSGIKEDLPFGLTVSIDDGTGNSVMKKTVACLAQRQRIIASVYGGTGDEVFSAVKCDAYDNLYVVGKTTSEGLGGNDGLIIKFDSSLNILAKKRYGGTGDDQFSDVALDSTGNVFITGVTTSEGSGGVDAFIIKFNKDLVPISKFLIKGTGNDYGGEISIDHLNNVIVSGTTSSESASQDGLIVKLDNNLNILYKKFFGGSGDDQFGFRNVIDSNNNIILIGFTGSEGIGTPTYGNALIIKLDSQLNLLAKKVISGSLGDEFLGVAVDASDNIYAVGYTCSDGNAAGDGLFIKFDSSLNILIKKRYYGLSGYFNFRAIRVDKAGNIYVFGYQSAESLGGADAFVMKLDSSLNILMKKRYGGTGSDFLVDGILDSNNNIIAVSYTTSEGAGDNDAYIIKMPETIPAGTFTGTVLTGLTFADVSVVNSSDSSLTVADSTLTLSPCVTLTLGVSNLTMATSNLTQKRDVIN